MIHPVVESWFAAREWRPFAFQSEVWEAYLRGESGLIHSATGTGKTVAAFLGPVIEWLNENPESVLAGQPARKRGKADTSESLRCLLYTSPSPRDRQKSRMPSSA